MVPESVRGRRRCVPQGRRAAIRGGGKGLRTNEVKARKTVGAGISPSASLSDQEPVTAAISEEHRALPTLILTAPFAAPGGASVPEPRRSIPRGISGAPSKGFTGLHGCIGPPSALARFKRPRRSRPRLPASSSFGKPAFHRAVRASSAPRGLPPCGGAIRGRLRCLDPMPANRRWKPPTPCGYSGYRA